MWLTIFVVGFSLGAVVTLLSTFSLVRYLLKEEQDKKYSKEEVELIANEMSNWVIDNIGKEDAKSGKRFDEILSKF